ncbi:MAG: PBECR4 domain-containing protein, partial [Bacilli bacterium]|nr:PBECR4 domain-containing protein [Bacilli bacterium]
VRNQLVEAAKSYSKLLNVKITVSSNLFVVSDKYILRFYKTNFLHLTGVKTNLNAEEFLIDVLMSLSWKMILIVIQQKK